MDIRLRPLRDDEFGEYLQAAQAEYARSLVDEAGMSRDDAEAKSEADHASLFPDGVRQPQQRLSVVEHAARADGLSGVDLNVWGAIRVARRLYLSAGYHERAVVMSKELV